MTRWCLIFHFRLLNESTNKVSHANGPICAHMPYQACVAKDVFGFYFSLKESSVAEGREKAEKLKATWASVLKSKWPKKHCRGDRELRLQYLNKLKTMDAGVSDLILNHFKVHQSQLNAKLNNRNCV